MTRNGFIVAVGTILLAFGVIECGAAESLISPRPVVQENFQKLISDNACPGCDLAGANLNRVDLSGVDLQGANLAGAKLYLADLSSANLQKVNLQGAILGGADLANADLRGANLTGAMLEGAYLNGALMDGTLTVENPYQEKELAEVEETVFKENDSISKHVPYTQDLDGEKKVNVKKRRDFNETPPVTDPIQENEESVIDKAVSASGNGQVVPIEDDVMGTSKKIPRIGEAVVPANQVIPKQNSGDMGGDSLHGASEEKFGEFVTEQPGKILKTAMNESEKPFQPTVAKTSPIQIEKPEQIKENTQDDGESFLSKVKGFFALKEEIQEINPEDNISNPEVIIEPVSKKLPDVQDNVKASKAVDVPEGESSILGFFDSKKEISQTGYGTVKIRTGSGDVDKQKLLDRLLDTNRCVECRLSQVNLAGSGLKKADLERASLQGADLHEIDLRGANLKNVDFQNANLKDADLRGADLYKANFDGANLTGARFDEAIIELTDFNGAIGADLTGAVRDK